MESLKIAEALASGADAATIAALVVFIRHHTRLTKLETTLKLVVNSLKLKFD